MGRRGRTEQKGMFYHVIQRGNNRKYVFKEEIDKGYLIKQFKHYKEGLGYRIYGFVILDNHYHFIIQTLSEKLQTIMHRINSKYGHYYNYRYKHLGHVFQGRYKAILVQDEKYLLGLLRYIHQNPMRANMASCISEYKWSSDIYYRTNIQKGLVDIDLVLNMIGSERKKSIIEYRKFMDTEELQEIDTFEEVACVGEEAYIKIMKSTGIRPEIVDLDTILWNTGANQEQFQLIKERSRKRELTPYKISYIKAGLKAGYTMKEIGDNIGINQSAVNQLNQNK